ncbi:MAG: hypothetical protein R3F56_08900 [Planctomycetota bacterium]
MRVSRRLGLAVLPLIASLGLGPAARAQLVPKLKDLVPKSDPNVIGLTGVWRGTATESTEEMGELSFPVELTFEGEPAKLRLRVTGKVKVPTENGQKLTVAIAASYEGALRGEELRMRSTRIDTRIVETGTTIPSAPQSVEARLHDGVLEGRVGSDGDGWTSFTARPAAAAEQPGPQAAASLAGEWRGTGREPGPTGRELSYPVRVTVRDEGGRWTVEVSADLQYPVQTGGTTPVEYRASFAGEVSGGELQMRSRSVKVKIVDYNQTQDGGEQTLNGRLEQDVLRLTVQNEGRPPAEFELRRVDDGQRPRPAGEERVEDDRDRGEGRGSPTGNPLGRRRGGPSYESPYTALVLEPRRTRDPMMGGVESHTILVPNGWDFSGGPQWVLSPDNYVHFVADLTGPRRESVHFDWNRVVTWTQVSGQPPPAPTPVDAGAEVAIVRPPPQVLGEVAAEIILPRARPRATNIRVVAAERLPQVEEAVRKLHAEELKMLEALMAQSRTAIGGVQTDANMFLVAERARVRYTENGVEWEEEVRSTQQGVRNMMRSELVSSDSAWWMIYDVRCVRAPVGELDARLPTLLSIASTLRETPRWSAALAELRLELAKARTRAMQIDFEARRKHYAELAATRNEISDIQMRGWRDRQDSQDRVHKATIDSIRGTNDFRAADGTTFVVSNQFERAFADPGGRVLLTNDVNYQPSADGALNSFQWEEMRRVDPFGR